LKVHNVREALQRLSEWKPDVLIGDIGIPSEDRYDLIRTIRASGCDAPAHQPTELCRLIATLISRDK
jgi:CheY-like chemotaxis protein